MGTHQYLRIFILMTALIAGLASCSRPSELNGPLNDDGYKVKLESVQKSVTIGPGQSTTVDVKVTNMSNLRWMSVAAADSNVTPNSVALSYHIRTSDNLILVWDGLRTVLPGNIIEPMHEILLHAKIRAPNFPGKYIIEYDMVQEGVSWFSPKGAQTTSITLEVKN